MWILNHGCKLISDLLLDLHDTLEEMLSCLVGGGLFKGSVDPAHAHSQELKGCAVD